jgi:hypothetical protein
VASTPSSTVAKRRTWSRWCTVASTAPLEVAEVFGLGRSAVYRAIERQRVEARAGLAKATSSADTRSRCRLFRCPTPPAERRHLATPKWHSAHSGGSRYGTAIDTSVGRTATWRLTVIRGITLMGSWVGSAPDPPSLCNEMSRRASGSCDGIQPTTSQITNLRRHVRVVRRAPPPDDFTECWGSPSSATQPPLAQNRIAVGTIHG